MSTKSNKRHVPLRSCVVCGNKTTKSELVRIVATPDGAVQVDTTGKLPGRGGYICKDASCMRGRLKRGRLEHALRTSLRNEEWIAVMSLLETSAVVRQEPQVEIGGVATDWNH